jgi:hypothetical protein
VVAYESTAGVYASGEAYPSLLSYRSLLASSCASLVTPVMQADLLGLACRLSVRPWPAWTPSSLGDGRGQMCSVGLRVCCLFVAFAFSPFFIRVLCLFHLQVHEQAARSYQRGPSAWAGCIQARHNERTCKFSYCSTSVAACGPSLSLTAYLNSRCGSYPFAIRLPSCSHFISRRCILPVPRSWKPCGACP